VVSASLLGALAGSAAAFVVGDRLGRKRELQLGAALYGARGALPERRTREVPRHSRAGGQRSGVHRGWLLPAVPAPVCLGCRRVSVGVMKGHASACHCVGWERPATCSP
jgi:hypothetical protein